MFESKSAFVMREADLASGNFDRVHAIYQQT
jgi:hypothetical protein